MKRTSKGAYKKSKDKAPVLKGQQLPGGIIGGIARFSAYKLGMDKNGNPYLHLTGTVISPEEHNGARAQVSHFLSKSRTKTVQDKYDDMFSSLQLLGIETAEMEETQCLEQVVDSLGALAEDKPAFRFNTWRPKDADADTMVFIQGMVDEGEIKDAIKDEEGSWDDDEEEEEDDDDGVTDEEDDEDGEEAGEAEEEDEDGGDEAEDDEYEDEEEGEEGDEDEEEGEDDDEDDGSDDGDDWEPARGEIYRFKVNARAKPQDCEVTSVNKSKSTVNLKRESDGKVFKAVPWDRLEDAE